MHYRIRPQPLRDLSGYHNVANYCLKAIDPVMILEFGEVKKKAEFAITYTSNFT